jgi:diguanylate cyclase (GGDEF)-like protein
VRYNYKCNDIAAALAQSMRETDFVCRLHGDEFGVIMPETEREGCVTAGRRVIEALDKRQPLARVRDRTMNATISCGGACFPADASTAEEIFDKADAALYEAKREGKNRVLMWGDFTQNAES